MKRITTPLCMTAALALALAGAVPAQAQFEDPEFEEDEFEEPDFEEPDFEEPDFEEPEIEEPEVDEPDFEEPDFEEPEVEEPELDEPEVEEPELDEPEIEEPEVEEPELDEPEIEEPEVDEPELDEPEVETFEAEEAEIESLEVEDLEADQAEVDEPELEEPEIESGEANEDDAPEFEDGDTDESDDDRFEGVENGDDGGMSDDGEASSAEVADDDTGDFDDTDWLADLAQAENPEFDAEGFPVTRSEIIAIDLSEAAAERLAEQGFVALERTELAALDTSLTRLAVPEGASAQAGLAQARALDAGGIYDLGHYYGAPFAASGSAGFSIAARPEAERDAPAGTLRIGLIDSAVQDAGRLRQVAIEQQDFGAGRRQVDASHGTAVATILNRFGASELVVANVFEDGGRGNFTSAETISRALGWLAGRGVDVVNVSLTGPRNAVLDAIVDRALDRGTVIVAAAGNNGPAAPPVYPAALPGVVAVTAVDDRRRVYRYANRGAYIDLAAHGVQVAVSLADGDTRYFTGTSFAAPRVAARLAACRRQGISADDCLTRLTAAAVDLGEPGRDDVYGFGYVE